MPKFLFKANDRVLSFCECMDQPAMSTGQLDCPWCGCGWLIACSNCLKSFVFAEVRETAQSLVDLGRREVSARGLSQVTDQEIEEWALGMSEMLDGFAVGATVVYLDGSYWNVDAVNVEFTGYFATHKFQRLPHAEALSKPEHLRDILGNKNYWLARERPDRD